MKKKRLLALLLSATMITAMAAGCGSAGGSSDAGAADADAGAADAAGSVAAEEDASGVDVSSAAEGEVLVIQCWNTEFQSRVADHYPGYEKINDTTGKIGDVTVVWKITPSDDNAYQNNLDTVLENNADAKPGEKTDMFLIEADYALKYIDSDYVMPIADLGITDEDIADQYQYTKDIVTDSNGVLKGLSWQACPGIMFYNRDIAIDVFGTDDPEAVQEYVKDWDTFTATAETMKEHGYKMTSTVNDTYRTYSNNVTSKWVEDGKLNIDDNIMKWVEDSKAMVDAETTAGTYDLWSDEWNNGMKSDSGVFAYFGPAWLINFCMHADEEGYVANEGKWAGTVGPQSFYWGGTWICASTETDNADLVKDIMLQLTCNPEIMQEIVEADDDFVNNQPTMEAMAESDYTSDILGGQNPLPMYCEGVKTIDLSNLSIYDQGCTEEFQHAMKNYFDGNATLDEALELFYKAISEKYPSVELPQ